LQGVGTNGAIQLRPGFTMDLDVNSATNKTRLTLFGPADRWLAVGFVGSNMSTGDIFFGFNIWRVF
jgi:hypothetical protein